MSLAKQLADEQCKKCAWKALQRSKLGDYANPDDGCPNCQRHRIMRGADGKHRCEKCCWCVEDGDYDYELLEYLR